PAEAVEGALTWGSPWGEGRPGWHIECSAMSTAHLGESFDIHLAGRDIIFPHNENEIAQSEAATGQTFASCWVHHGLLKTEGDKMSTSLANYFVVEDAVERWGANVVRTFLLSVSHGGRQAFSEAAMAEATARWERLERGYDRLLAGLDSADARARAGDDALREAVELARASATAALDDDLDTRGALVALEGLAGAVLDHVDAGAPYDYPGLLGAHDAFATFGEAVLGLSFEATAADAHLEAVLEAVVAHREALRGAEAYEVADDLRDRLREAGVELEDTPEGPRVRLRTTD
ncbi:MAG: class I tRNA ligase family protein, partial [Halobacteriales archaeon]